MCQGARELVAQGEAEDYRKEARGFTGGKRDIRLLCVGGFFVLGGRRRNVPSANLYTLSRLLLPISR